MGIKFSVGVSETKEEREQLEEVRQKPPVAAPGAALDSADEPRLLGWPMRVSLDDEHDAAQPHWAW